MPSLVLNNKTPFEIPHNVKTSGSHLKAFACLCYASTLKRKRENLQPRANPCIFLGYPYGQKTYKLLELTTNKVFISRDVFFNEQVFPFQNVKHQFDLPLPTVTQFDPDTHIFI